MRAYNGHIGNHHSNRTYQKYARCCSLLTRKEVSVQYLDKHEENYLKNKNHALNVIKYSTPIISFAVKLVRQYSITKCGVHAPIKQKLKLVHL